MTQLRVVSFAWHREAQQVVADKFGLIFIFIFILILILIFIICPNRLDSAQSLSFGRKFDRTNLVPGQLAIICAAERRGPLVVWHNKTTAQVHLLPAATCSAPGTRKVRPMGHFDCAALKSSSSLDFLRPAGAR